MSKTKDYFDCNFAIVASNLDDGLSTGTVVAAFGFKVFIVVSNRLLGLSAGTAALQLVLHRLLTVASKRCEGVVVVALEVVEVVELLPPLQEAKRMVDKPKENIQIYDFIFLTYYLTRVKFPPPL